MKKLTKLLSVFLIAGAVGTGVAGITACSPKQPETPHEHTAATEWQSDANGHWKNCTANDGAKLEEGAHADGNNDGKCDTCQYQMTTPATGFVVPAGTDSLVIEGVTEEVTLSTTNTSHTIDKTAIKVYLSAKGVKGTEVPAANYDLELYLNGETKVTEWTGLKQDADYVVVAILKDAVDESGKAVSLEGEITVTVNNAIVSLALKTGTLTQVQGANTMTADWTFEATRANGDKEDIAAADVEIGTMDTNTVGENKEVTITLKGTAVTGKVTYSVTADESKVSQAYALNFSFLTADEEAKIRAGEAVSLQGGRFEVQSTKCDTSTGAIVAGDGYVDNHKKTYGEQYFAKRLKVNGTSSGNMTHRYIKVKADGAGTITIVAYNNSTSTGRHIALYGSRTAGTSDTYADQVGTSVEIAPKGADGTVHQTVTFDITKAGNYYITCDASMTFCYVQLDQLVDAGEGVAKVELGGATVVSELTVTKPETVTNFKVGDTFNHNGYTVKATGVNNVTCVSSVADVTLDAEFVAPDMTTIGEKEVKVNYGGASTSYNVIVESAVDGIYGATAKLATTLDTFVSTADAKATVTKDDIVVELLGVNAEATTTYTVTYNDVEITTGTEFAIGEYELVVTVTVTAGAQEDQIVCKIALKVEQESASTTESWLYQTANPTIDATNPNVANGEVIVSNSAFTATALNSAKSGYNRDSVNFATKIIDSGNAPKAAASSTMSGAEMTFTNALAFDTKAGTGTNYVQVVANKAITVYVYMNASDDKHGSNRAGAAITYTVNGTAGTDIAVSVRKSVSVVKVTLAQGDTLVVGAKKGTATSDPRIWFYGIEAENA